MPYRKIKVKSSITHILHLPNGQRILIHSTDNGSFQVWDLEKGMQFVGEWEDKETGVEAVVLSPNGKTIATGSEDGTVELWNADTGKVIKTLNGHTKEVKSVCWSSDGEQVVSGFWDETFRVWDVKNGKTTLGPIKAGRFVWAVCYSPNTKMIATGRLMGLKIWDANTGNLLKTLTGVLTCLAWTSDGKTLITGGSGITKFNTTTWSQTAVMEHRNRRNYTYTLPLYPNERILTSTSSYDKIAQLWSTETNQPIGTPLHHEDHMNSATSSADGKFIVTSCPNGHLYTWDISAIVKKAGLKLLNNDNVVSESSNVDYCSSQDAANKPVPVFNPDADATPRRPREAPEVAEDPSRRIPKGFF
ncbi:WD40 repeat-like protein [Suillus decipiens]|nr:WD40 repeat-like protein [Suillus decipiens]